MKKLTISHFRKRCQQEIFKNFNETGRSNSTPAGSVFFHLPGFTAFQPNQDSVSGSFLPAATLQGRLRHHAHRQTDMHVVF